MNSFSNISKRSVILILLIAVIHTMAYRQLPDDDDADFEDNDDNDSILKNFQEFSNRKLVQSARHRHRHHHYPQQSVSQQAKLHQLDASGLSMPIDDSTDIVHRKSKKTKNNDGNKNLDGNHNTNHQLDHNKKNVSRRGQRLKNSNNNNKNGNQLFKTTFLISLFIHIFFSRIFCFTQQFWLTARVCMLHV